MFRPVPEWKSSNAISNVLCISLGKSYFCTCVSVNIAGFVFTSKRYGFKSFPTIISQPSSSYVPFIAINFFLAAE